MVDHRADDDGGFRVYVKQDGQGQAPLADLGARIGAWFRQKAAPGAAGQRPRSDRYLLPLGVSVVWLLVVAAYGFGYYLQHTSGTGSDRAFPTIDILFFTMVCFGPIAMIWIVALMLSKAERLTDTIAAQSESAVALATTIATLNDSVDAMSAGTIGRLEETCDRMERETARAIAELGKALKDVSSRVEATVLDSVILMDRSNRERLHQVEETLAAERGAFADRLNSDASRMAEKIDQNASDTKSLLDDAIDAAMRDHQTRLARVAHTIDAALGELANNFAQAVHTRDQKIDAEIEQQTSRLAAVTREIETTLSDLAKTVSHGIDTRSRSIETSLKDQQAVLHQAAEATRQTIQKDLVRPISSVRQMLAGTVDKLAANPPASAEALSALLAEAAERMIAPERERLAETQARMSALQETARTMLAQIDRTARLNPVLTLPEPDQSALALDDTATDNDGSGLLFDQALPEAPTRKNLDWTAVLRVLDRTEARPGTRRAIAIAASDPDVVALMTAVVPIREGLAADGVFLEDLKPDHAPASIWADFARGKRGTDVSALAGIDDDVARAIIRARLRRPDGFRGDALRFAHCYITLLSRAAHEIGDDPRLVEMAETETGRAFVALADALGLLDGATPDAVTTER